jgi:hypothetical protein
MTRRTTWTRLAGFAGLGLLAATSANADGRGSNSGGDSWLQGELHHQEWVQPYGYASPNRMEYRPFYGYGYPYTPYPSPRAVIQVQPYGYAPRY